MKGSRRFTPEAGQEIRRLLVQTRQAEPARQKGLRQQIRDRGFFISDFTRPTSGFRREDFDALVASGAIEII
jgi:hypothetical protein